jgi:hypothetical protein
MDNAFDLAVLLALVAFIGLWMKLSRAREIAMGEARRQCERHGLQLLDETVGLRHVRVRRHQGAVVFERCYEFEVSIDGDDREPGKLWMAGGDMSALSLPTLRLLPAAEERAHDTSSGSNVVPLRRRDGSSLH